MMDRFKSFFESGVNAGGDSGAKFSMVIIMQQQTTQQNQMQKFQAMQMQMQMQQFQHTIMNQVYAMEHCAMNSDQVVKNCWSQEVQRSIRNKMMKMWRVWVHTTAVWAVEKIRFITELYADKFISGISRVFELYCIMTMLWFKEYISWNIFFQKIIHSSSLL